MDTPPKMFGCIDNDSFSFASPRMVDEECETLERAMEEALEMIKNGTEEVAICRCKYYGSQEDWDNGNGYWGEIVGEGQITVNAYNAEWVTVDEEEEA